jgi:hypothetical protein
MAKLDHVLYGEVCDLLFDAWDPIGVSGLGGPRDEYDSYAQGLIRIIRDGADLYRVTQYLREAALVSMGLSQVDAQRDQQVARQLIALIRGE